MHRSTRFLTVLLACGAAVLLLAVAIGERMGNRVIGQATEQTLQSVIPQEVTPAPDATPVPYGPDWKRSQALTASGDPRFPDPRVPPQPLPTLAPTPPPRPKPLGSPLPPTPTINPNIPIWRQQPLPTAAPYKAAPGSSVPITPVPAPTSSGQPTAPPPV
jgi:hypothetical protein